MTTIIDGGPAFPVPYTTTPSDDLILAMSGMSLRDWFAGQALVGGELHADANNWAPEGVATRAYRIADAMLAARKEGQGGGE